MYKEHPSFNTPPDDAMIWRYMSLDRFASLFDERMLYFCSMEKLKKGDPHEGSYYACKLLNDVEPEEAQGFAQKASSCGDPIVVNCWHLSDHESMAMWKLYSKDNKGIAIQSRIKRLKTEFVNFKDSVFIGEIIYTDDPIDDPSGWPIVIFTSCMTKRKCFEHEKELRALIWNTNEDIPREEDGSVKIPIQPRHLIENIYISPFADDSTVYEVQQIASKHQFEIVPIKSDLMDKPLY